MHGEHGDRISGVGVCGSDTGNLNQTVRAFSIFCEFRIRPSMTYTQDGSSVSVVTASACSFELLLPFPVLLAARARMASTAATPSRTTSELPIPLVVPELSPLTRRTDAVDERVNLPGGGFH